MKQGCNRYSLPSSARRNPTKSPAAVAYPPRSPLHFSPADFFFPFLPACRFLFPLQKTAYAESHIAVRRKIAPISHTYDKKPIYCITDRDYNDILSTIKHTGCTYERTPASYKSLHEEDLRNTLLAALNASYMGDAFGEAFRNNGKTDIAKLYSHSAKLLNQGILED